MGRGGIDFFPLLKILEFWVSCTGVFFIWLGLRIALGMADNVLLLLLTWHYID